MQNNMAHIPCTIYVIDNIFFSSRNIPAVLLCLSPRRPLLFTDTMVMVTCGRFVATENLFPVSERVGFCSMCMDFRKPYSDVWDNRGNLCTKSAMCISLSEECKQQFSSEIRPLAMAHGNMINCLTAAGPSADTGCLMAACVCGILSKCTI